MTTNIKRPERWAHKSAPKLPDFQFSDGTKVPRFRVETFQALTQLIGYAKHTNQEWDIYYRGQCEAYDSMRPALYRKQNKREARVQNRNRILKTYIEKHRSDLDKLHIPEYAVEPTLQHYGFKTRWIDLVDNIWVSLWFGLYGEKSRTNKGTTFAHIDKRTDNGSQYLYLIATDAKVEDSGKHGHYSGLETILIDLRKACPSQFIRPHAQHGLLLRRKNTVNENHKDLTEFVVCVIELPTATVREWIKDSDLLSPNFIYPSPYFDEGYSDLLVHVKKPSSNEAEILGSISQVSY